MSTTEPENAHFSSGENQLAQRSLGGFAIFFLVVSAAAPLTVVVNSGLAFHYGGIGAPGSMLAAGVALFLFACGLTAMSRHVRNAGAFYAYAATSLGKPTGIGVAAVTTFSYFVLVISFYAWLGYFAAISANDLLGIDLPWWVYTFAGIIIAGILGYRHIDVGAKVIAVLVTAESAILVALAIAVLIDGGPAPLSIEPFTFSNVFFAEGAGALFVLGFGSYLGFEGTVIYAEEAKDPKRDVTRATYGAIAFLAIFYAFMFWILTVAFGVDGLMKLMSSDHFADVAFTATQNYLGTIAQDVMRILIVTSFLACAIAFHNACTRYIFSMGREGLLPNTLGKTHPVMHSPHRASLALSVIVALVFLASIAVGADPYTQTALWSYSAGVIGLVFVQAMAACSVVAYFRNDTQGYSRLRVIVAPALGALALFVGVFLIVSNFDVITGLHGLPNWLMIGPTPVLFILGIIAGLIIKRRNPRRYNKLNELSAFK